jgi:hypothetical protein
MRRVVALGMMVVVGSLVAGAGTAAAQTTAPPWLLTGSYGYLHENGVGGGPSTTYAKGWFVAVDRRIGGGRFRAAGEIGGSYRDNAAVETQSLYAYLGGIRVNLLRLGPAHIFVHVLAGVERFSEPGFSEHGFAFQPGGGVDVAITQGLGVRVQGDFRAAHQEGVTINEARFGIGVVFGFGH